MHAHDPGVVQARSLTQIALHYRAVASAAAKTCFGLVVLVPVFNGLCSPLKRIDRIRAVVLSAATSGLAGGGSTSEVVAASSGWWWLSGRVFGSP